MALIKGVIDDGSLLVNLLTITQFKEDFSYKEDTDVEYKASHGKNDLIVEYNELKKPKDGKKYEFNNLMFLNYGQTCGTCTGTINSIIKNFDEVEKWFETKRKRITIKSVNKNSFSLIDEDTNEVIKILAPLYTKVDPLLSSLVIKPNSFFHVVYMLRKPIGETVYTSYISKYKLLLD